MSWQALDSAFYETTNVGDKGSNATEVKVITVVFMEAFNWVLPLVGIWGLLLRIRLSVRLCLKNNPQHDSIYDVCSTKGGMEYRYLTNSIGGFIQQLAVCYIQRGYWFYVVGSIPAGKDPEQIDRKLLDQYGISLSKYQRCRRKKYGQANLQYLRYQNTFLLLATQGEHPFFAKEHNVIRDVRRIPMECFGYSLTYRNGHALVSISKRTYQELNAYFLELALRRNAKTLAWEFRALPFEPYKPVYRQLFTIWKAVNAKRHQAGFDLILHSALRCKRRIYQPFASDCKVVPTSIKTENDIILTS